MRRFVVIFIAVLCSLGIHAQTVYYDAYAFKLIGKLSDSTETRYERLPRYLRNKTRKPVWTLGKNTSGLALRFRTNSTSVSARWGVSGNTNMSHMAFVGIKGVDLYCLNGAGKWTFVNSGKPQGKENEWHIISGMTPEEREYMLYLPLYDGITHIEIGIDSTAQIKKPLSELPSVGLPIIYYGTSITQGGCASRPGMAHTNILSRWLNKEIINLGFSGNGQLDYEIAELMGNYQAAAYIIDCMPNVSCKQVNEKLETFYLKLRKRHPETPILLIGNPIFPFSYFDIKTHRMLEEKNEALHAIYNNLKGRDKNLYYLPSKDIIGNDGEATVDGIHYTDLGFMRYAEHLYPIIKKLIKQ